MKSLIRVGLARAGGHHQQDAILPRGDGLHRAVDGDLLIVAGRLAACVDVVVLSDDPLFLVAELLPMSVALPEGLRRREGIEGDFLLRRCELGCLVVGEEGIAVGAEDVGNVQSLGIGQGLLHAVADGVLVVLGLDDGEWEVGLVVEDVVCAFLGAAGREASLDEHPAGGEGELLADLCLEVPAGGGDRGRDVLVPDLLLVEVLLTGHASSLPDVSSSSGLCYPR